MGSVSPVNPKRPCPVCGGTDNRRIFSQSFAHLGDVGLLDGYDVVVCSGCGCGYADRIPSQAELDAYYRNTSKYEYAHRGGHESEEDEYRMQQIAGTIRPFVRKPNELVLEVGCSTGKLLKLLCDSGCQRVLGLDPSPECAVAARKLHDVEVITGSLFDLTRPTDSYDLIILLCVLEHVRDLGLMIAKLREIVADQGRIYVEVPDAVHLTARQDAPFQDFSIEHINFFSVRSLANLMEVGGFRTIECDYTTRRQKRGAAEPMVFGVFEKSGGFAARPAFDAETEAALSEYVAHCVAAEERVREKIAAATAQPILVWGVGTHTRRLLASGVLPANRVVRFVDSNVKYQNQVLAGVPVIGPDAVRQYSEPILICTHVFQREIERQIRRDLKLPNQLILLYD